VVDDNNSELTALFVWLISHQPAVLFLSEQTSTSHQPPAKRTGWVGELTFPFPFLQSPLFFSLFLSGTVIGVP
jgi:hypothetical protein